MAVPPATMISIMRSYSACEPSAQTMAEGWQSSAFSRTKARTLALVVGALERAAAITLSRSAGRWEQQQGEEEGAVMDFW
jgi:hypothetical protein